MRTLEKRRGLEAPTGLTAETIGIGGLERAYWLAAPPDGDTGDAPLLIVLHGAVLRVRVPRH